LKVERHGEGTSCRLDGPSQPREEATAAGNDLRDDDEEAAPSEPSQELSARKPPYVVDVRTDWLLEHAKLLAAQVWTP
jgi:hypothetical protein